MSVLLYLASGNYRPEYEELEYDKIILVDRSFNSKFPRPANSKVELIWGDALDAIKKLKRREDLRIDCLVSVNEGLFEGGGDYVIFSEFLLGYLSPILSDELLVITDISYYNVAAIGKKVAKMDWGFESVKVEREHPQYIYPGIFTTYEDDNNPDYGNVFLLKRKKNQTALPISPRLDINVVHGSIWEDEDRMDLLGFNIRPRRDRGYRRINEFFQNIEGLYDIHGKSIEEILAYAEENKVKHLGLTPWMNGDYGHVMDVLSKYEPSHLQKITFYHLRKKDFGVIYGRVDQLNAIIDF